MSSDTLIQSKNIYSRTKRTFWRRMYLPLSFSRLKYISYDEHTCCQQRRLLKYVFQMKKNIPKCCKKIYFILLLIVAISSESNFTNLQLRASKPFIQYFSFVKLAVSKLQPLEPAYLYYIQVYSEDSNAVLLNIHARMHKILANTLTRLISNLNIQPSREELLGASKFSSRTERVHLPLRSFGCLILRLRITHLSFRPLALRASLRQCHSGRNSRDLEALTSQYQLVEWSPGLQV